MANQELIEVLTQILAIVGSSGLLAAILPPARANMIYAVLRVILNLAGANWGSAINKNQDVEVLKKRGSRRPGG